MAHPSITESSSMSSDAFPKDSEALTKLCQKIRDRHEADWREDSTDELGDGEEYFQPFLEDLP